MANLNMHLPSRTVTLYHVRPIFSTRRVGDRFQVWSAAFPVGTGVEYREDLTTSGHLAGAQATEKSALERLQTELRDRFGPLPSALELLPLVGELKILAGERGITAMEVKEDRLMLTQTTI